MINFVKYSYSWPAKIALADLRQNVLRTWMDVLIVANVLALVIILWGLRSGVVVGFATEQLNTPESLRIFVVPRGPIRAEQLAFLEAQPEIGFVGPNIGFLNQKMEIRNKDSTSKDAVALVVSSGPGDPYLNAERILLQKTGIVLGEDLAEVLGAKVGDQVELVVAYRPEVEPVFLTLTIAGVVEASSWNERAAFIHKDLAAALSVYSYADLGRIDLSGSKHNFGLTNEDEFDSVRLYARDIETVSSLVRKINSLGWRGESREALIAERIALDQSTRTVFVLVVGFCASIVLVSFILSLSSRLLRLRDPIRVLEGHGLHLGEGKKILVIQNLFIAIVGWVIGTVLAAVCAQSINWALEDWMFTLGITGPACRLTAAQIGAAGVTVLILAILVSWLAGGKILRTESYATK